ncbi:MAG: ricin-type beta-trefoil lectin domain protein [Acidobacteriaceae bacterium]|nr:ricin-type beta-trefoil lectin domain protein [Acidobacteriaceae bacterium]MBV9780689.1 ricin-type beta-trefoil lectin domain protein [Acidobacteriaceae bacterium]
MKRHIFQRSRFTRAAARINQTLPVFGALALLGMLAAGVSSMNAAVLQINSSAPFVCAAVEGGKTDNGTPVLAYSCSVAFSQDWNYVEGQFVGLGTANGEAKCLDVKGAATAPGTLVDLYNCNGGENQQWKIINGAEIGLPASTLIRSNQTDLCLDSAGPSVGGGKQLVMNKCTGATSQNWNVRNIHFQINSNAPFVCEAVEGAFTANGTPVLAYSCSGDIPQEWSYSDGKLEGIGTANGGAGKCLEVKGAATDHGSLVDLHDCNGGENQQWKIINGRDIGLAADSTVIYGVQSQLCLDSAGPSVGGGKQLVINRCTGATSQNWNVR